MKSELLAPAGDLNRLKTAFYYGADAVYLGGKNFSLRSYADNFTMEELEAGVRYAHALGKKVYVAANIFLKNDDIPAMKTYLGEIYEAGADGAIVADPATVYLAKRHVPKLPLHLSTQANTLNKLAAKFWEEQGVSRLVLARELSAKEIAEIHRESPVELEAFVHGAMCISYSGRCLLSNYLAHRDGNRGECVQACRWQYEFRDKKAGGDWLTAEEDERGTYFLNSKDLNLIRRLGELKENGVTSFKIEGRMKGEYYLATVVNAYRRVLDELERGNVPDYECYGKELIKIAHRAYTEGYWNGDTPDTVNYANAQLSDEAIFVGKVTTYDEKTNTAEVEMRNRFHTGDALEILSPSEAFGKRFTVPEMKNAEGNLVTDAKLVQEILTFPAPCKLNTGDILRKLK